MTVRVVYEVMQELQDGRAVHHKPATTEKAAQAELDRFTASQTARGYPPERMWIDRKEVDTDFVVPPEDTPGDLYFVETGRIENRPGTWDSTSVRVMRWTDREKVASVQVGEYTRNYSMLGTFCPFRQLRDGEWKPYALISPEYVRTSVMDLTTGQIIATGPVPTVDQELADKYPDKYKVGDELAAFGFCPAEFYVPDWWEFHDDDLLPGSHIFERMRGDRPTGEFGFVAGCVWGDDSSWKVQYLDLSRISEGILGQDDRYGYIELPPAMDLKDAVHYDPEIDSVQIATPITFGRDGTHRYGPKPDDD